MDIKAISKTYYGKIKAGIGLKAEYGKFFKKENNDYFLKIFDRPQINLDLINFLKSKNDIKTVLEIGCSVGNFPIKFYDVFSNLEYTGIDFSEKSIDYCKNHSNFEFICGDFLKMQINKKYDFVFSMAVIDHVYDIDLFLTKIIQLTKKYAYIDSYRGYFPDLKQHRMKWRDDEGVYYSDISIEQVKKILQKNNLSSEEYTVRPLSLNDKSNHTDTIIEIVKKL